MSDKQYIAIDLKSFYASVECVQRGLDPLKTNLVVADPTRTEKTICLAVSPSLKSYGISGRARLYEVVERIRQVNLQRQYKAPKRTFTDESYDDDELKANPALKVGYIVAPPQMLLYEKVSAAIVDTYLKYVSFDDIHVYSVDEVFIDATSYLKTYKMTAHELAMTMIRDVLESTGITATAGIGSNMYLCKIAMDIVAKHIPADEDGVRIAELDEMSYREKLWTHKPITDFWRVGRGISKRLERLGIYTMGDIARCSILNEEVLYKEFGINAELLIDHAWGYEPCTIADVKGVKPKSQSISVGQVLQSPYTYDKARIIVREMTEGLVLDIVDKKIVTNQVELTIGYDIENLKKGSNYDGPVETDWYGRKIPKQAHSSENLGRYTSSTRLIMDAMMKLFTRIVNPDLTVRRMYVVFNHIKPESEIADTEGQPEQLDFFTDYEKKEQEKVEEKESLEKEKSIQQAMLNIQKKFGKNAILKGTNLQEGATGMERNKQVGGHKA